MATPTTKQYHEDKTAIQSLMKEHLPEYIMNCFIAAGYDTAGIIACMTVSDPPGNNDSIHEMQRYIAMECPDVERYCHPITSVAKFPPGHVILIKKFIKIVKETLSTKNGKDTRSTTQSKQPVRKKRRCDIQFHTYLNEVYSYLRCSITKWQHGKNPPQSSLVEHKHYEIMLELTAAHNDITGSIICKKFSTVIKLQKRESGELSCSNWYCHVLKDCNGLKASKNTSHLQFQSCTCSKCVYWVLQTR